MTNLYYLNRDLTATATVVSIDSGPTPAVILDSTNFHPQGGGQKSDVGTLGSVRVIRAEKGPEGIVHFVDSVAGISVGDIVELRVAGGERKLNSRLHTAGHLLAAVVESLAPGVTAKKGHHWSGESRVEFAVPPTWKIPDGFAAHTEEAMKKAIEADLRVMLEFDSAGRRVTIGDFPPVPCGGTHVASLSEIGSVIVRRAVVKGGVLRVSYDVASACSAGDSN